MSRRDEDRWSDIQRDLKGSSNGAGSHHGPPPMSNSGSYAGPPPPGPQGPNIDIPPAIMQIMRRHGIEPPISKSLFIANIAFEADERYIREIFSYAGRIVTIDLKRDPDGTSRGFGVIEFETEFEALQAICMFNGSSLYDRPLKVRFDVKADGALSKFPPGVRNLGPGFGPNGEPLPCIGVLQYLPELLQLMNPNVMSQIVNQVTGGSNSSASINNIGNVSSKPVILN